MATYLVCVLSHVLLGVFTCHLFGVYGRMQPVCVQYPMLQELDVNRCDIGFITAVCTAGGRARGLFACVSKQAGKSFPSLDCEVLLDAPQSWTRAQ